MRGDLHTHSTFSDGTHTPVELVEFAKQTGIDVLALTDHNTFNGLEVFMEAGRKAGLKTVAGIEISTTWENTVTGGVREVHVVGLNVPINGTEELNTMLADYARRKEESNINLEAGLKRIGIDVSLEEMKKTTPAGNINRAFFASEMVRKGYVTSVREAFDKYLRPKNGIYVEPERPSVQTAVSLLKKAGAVVVLGHPMLTFKIKEEAWALVEEVKGFDGLEAYYPSYSEEKVRDMEELADKKGLFKSGGSDYHGEVKPNVFLGSATCNPEWLFNI